MTVPDSFEPGGNFAAIRYGLRTARIERASGRRVQWAGDFPFEKDVFSIFFDKRIGDGHGRQ
jgi:hypothetical protein